MPASDNNFRNVPKMRIIEPFYEDDDLETMVHEGIQEPLSGRFVMHRAPMPFDKFVDARRKREGKPRGN